MASAEERAHAARLLKIHRENLERLEEKKAKFGLDAPQWVENQIDEERANIAALEPLVKPQPSQKVQEFVKSTASGEIDLMMLFLQGTQINARMTRQEEQNQKQGAQNQAIIEEQSRAALWRMQTGETINDLVVRFTASEQARKRGAKWYRIAMLIIFVWIILHQFGVFRVIGG